jgi:integrase
MSLAEFAQDFFAWTGLWAMDKRARGLRISEQQCDEMNRIVSTHIFLKIGNVKLIKIDSLIIKTLRNELYASGKSGSLINKAMNGLKMILEAAEEQNLIQSIPRIHKVAETPRRRGSLTVDEVRRIFSIEWSDYLCYTFNLLAATSGLRMGELKALMIGDVHDNYITVSKTWCRYNNCVKTGTKNGRIRNVFLPGRIVLAMQAIIKMNLNQSQDSFIFFSPARQGQPVENKYILRSLYAAMKKIGIDEDERKERNLTFHSWRHFYNSLLVNAKIPLIKIQSQTGHLSDEMTKHYYHSDDMGDVLQAVETLFVD